MEKSIELKILEKREKWHETTFLFTGKYLTERFPMTLKPNFPCDLYETTNFCYCKRNPLFAFLIRQIMRVVFSGVVLFDTKIERNIHFGFNG